MKIEDYTYNGEYGAIIHDENTKQRIFLTWDELREIFDWVLENDIIDKKRFKRRFFL